MGDAILGLAAATILPACEGMAAATLLNMVIDGTCGVRKGFVLQSIRFDGAGEVG